MLVFTQGSDKYIYVTLSEKVTLNEPNYLFVFTHITTKTQVVFVKLFTDDLSDSQTRYNKFTIASTIFQDAPVGQYEYEVYEQESTTNTDPDAATTLIEVGKAELKTSSEFSFTSYEPETTYIEYAG